MTACPAAIPVLAEAVETVGDEIGYNTTADAQFIVRHLDAAGLDIVPRRTDRPTPAVPLTETQRETLRAVAEGLSNAAMRQRWVLSQEAVKSRVKSLYGALGVSTQPQAVLVAVALGHATAEELLAPDAEEDRSRAAWLDSLAADTRHLTTRLDRLAVRSEPT